MGAPERTPELRFDLDIMSILLALKGVLKATLVRAGGPEVASLSITKGAPSNAFTPQAGPYRLLTEVKRLGSSEGQTRGFAESSAAIVA